MVESLAVELDQGKFEKLFFSGSASPKAMGNTAKYLLRLALESLKRFLLKWPTPLLTAQVVLLLKRF